MADNRVVVATNPTQPVSDDEEELADRNPSLVREPPKKRRKPNRISTVLPHRPKRAATAHCMYIKDYFQRQEDGLSRNLNSLVEVSSQWKNLSDERKQFFQNLAAPDRARYAREMVLWRQQRAFVKRPASSYALFLKETWANSRAAGTTLGIGEMGKLASQRWKIMPESEKMIYKTRYETNVEEQKTRLAELTSGNVIVNDQGVVGIVQPAANVQVNAEMRAPGTEMASDDNM